MDENFEPEKPVPSLYSLFESKPYLDLLNERIKAKKGEEIFYKAVKEELLDKKIKLMEKLRKVLLNVAYENNIIVPEKASVRKLLDILHKNNVEIPRWAKQEILDVHYKLHFIDEALRILEDESKQFEREKMMLQRLKDLLELYPKHLRFGNFNPFEVRATRFIADSYFSFFAKGLITGNKEALEIANFLILPAILNIQETSLSKEGYFLRLVHGSPVLSAQMGELEVPEEEIEETEKAEGLGRLFGLFKRSENEGEEENQRIIP